MKFGQLLEHNIRDIFLEKYGGVPFPDPFLKSQN